MKPEIYKIKEGEITIVHDEPKLSIGLLELNPNQSLDKHHRPIAEDLLQIQGESIIKIFNGDKLESKRILKKGEHIKIPANMNHIHSNETGNSSLTLWKFNGDISEILKAIRNTSERTY